jgi:hypothetical protein
MAGQRTLPLLTITAVLARKADGPCPAVPLAERNRAGRWADGSHSADTVYDRRHAVGTRDPLDAIPQFGGPARAADAEAPLNAFQIAFEGRLTPSNN